MNISLFHRVIAKPMRKLQVRAGTPQWELVPLLLVGAQTANIGIGTIN